MKHALCVVAMAGIFPLTGCESTQPAMDGRAEIRTDRLTGDVTILANAPLDRCTEAAVQVMNELQFQVERDSRDALKGIIAARMADDTMVRTLLERKGDQITQITVNAGAFKQGIAQLVMSKIQDRVR